MYDDTRKIVLAIADDLSKLMVFALKLGIMIGGICLLFYCHRISYFPSGVSAGDALLLIFLAGGFVVVYGIFVSCLLSLGLWLMLMLRPFIKLAMWLRRKITRDARHGQLLPELISPNILNALLGLLGIIVIYGINTKQPGSWIPMLGTALILGMLASTYCDFSAKLRTQVAKDKSPIVILGNTNSTEWYDTGKLRAWGVMCLVMICAVPLLMGGVSGLLLDSSMRFVGLREGTSIVLLEPPYNAILPKEYALGEDSNVKGYTAFRGVRVAFQGVGTKTVLEYATSDSTVYLAVPNDSVIVYPVKERLISRRPATSARD